LDNFNKRGILTIEWVINDDDEIKFLAETSKS
jgi:hypothetical protein